MIGCRDSARHDTLKFQHFERIENLFELGHVLGGCLPDDFKLFILAGIIDVNVEHESIKLSLGKGIGSFLLDGVLSCQDKERSGVGDAASLQCHLISCMASSRADCVLGGVRLISSARTRLAKIGPCRKRNSRSPVLRFSSDDLRPGDVGGHQVGSELNPAEGKAKPFGQRSES